MTATDLIPLEADETVIWQGQPRQRVVYHGITAGLVAALVVGAVAWAVASAGTASARLVAIAAIPVAALAFAVPALPVFLWRRTTRYLLTDDALYHRTGIVSVTVTELPLGKIQNTSYEQGVFGTLFGHGTVTVDTAGSEGAELRLRALDGPATVHAQIADVATQAQPTESADLPGTVSQWREVLAEVRGIRTRLRDD